MITYQRVLVPLDGSELAEEVLPLVEKLAGPVDAEVTLLRVVEPISAGEAMASAGVVTPDALLGREMDAKAYVATAARRMAAKGIRVKPRVSLGQPAEAILSAIGETGAELVAMTTHGRSGVARLLFGSVAEAVLRGSPVPVLLIRAHAPVVAAGSAR